jgi:VWA domain containing CoxE-like protein
MATTTQTHITLLVDQTGSMAPYASQVVDGLNYYTKALCSQTPGPVFASLMTFNTEVTTHYTHRPIHKVDKIRLETYQPEGSTALYDAISTVLTSLPGATGSGAQQHLLIILSDGEDVSSHTTLTDCADQVTLAQARGVRIVFLGDGPEALALADLLGIPAGCRYLFMARDGLKQVFEQLATQTVQAISSVVSEGLLPERFFAEEQRP